VVRESKKLKEYEYKKTMRLMSENYPGTGKYFDLITRLTYTPFDGGKGWIVQIGPVRSTPE